MLIKVPVDVIVFALFNYNNDSRGNENVVNKIDSVLIALSDKMTRSCKSLSSSARILFQNLLKGSPDSSQPSEFKESLCNFGRLATVSF